MQSKTGGIYSKPIVPGSFEWRWERLLPTNVTLTAFSTEPVNSVLTVSGTLPGGETYSSLLEGNPSFSYSMTLQITASVAPEDILELFSTIKFLRRKILTLIYRQLQSRSIFTCRKGPQKQHLCFFLFCFACRCKFCNDKGRLWRNHCFVCFGNRTEYS